MIARVVQVGVGLQVGQGDGVVDARGNALFLKVALQLSPLLFRYTDHVEMVDGLYAVDLIGSYNTRPFESRL